MPKLSRGSRRTPSDETAFIGTRRAAAPHEFVLDALASLVPTTRPMFGCLAVYVEDKIVLILRDRKDFPADNGVWLATTQPHHESLQCLFPHMRSIQLFGKSVTHWQVLATDAPDFEQASLAACALIRARDPRIGKVPKRRSIPRSPVKRIKTRGFTKKATQSPR
jgi:hypothetical protein